MRQTERRRPADGAGDRATAAAEDLHELTEADFSEPRRARQVADIDGHPLPAAEDRWPVIEGAPRRAVPGWVKWTVDRWSWWRP